MPGNGNVLLGAFDYNGRELIIFLKNNYYFAFISNVAFNDLKALNRWGVIQWCLSGILRICLHEITSIASQYFTGCSAQALNTELQPSCRHSLSAQAKALCNDRCHRKSKQSCRHTLALHQGRALCRETAQMVLGKQPGFTQRKNSNTPKSLPSSPNRSCP